MSSTTIKAEIISKINAIKDDSIHGAHWLSQRAVEAIKLAANVCDANNTADFLKFVQMVGKSLILAKPNMAPIRNRMSKLILEVSKLAEDDKVNLEILKRIAFAKADELLRESERSVQSACQNAAAMLDHRDTIMTCSYSSTVIDVLKMAHNSGKQIEVIVPESRFRDKLYGELLAQTLTPTHIKVRIIPDRDISIFIRTAEKILVGADTIFQDGTLINGTPTYQIAKAAKGKVRFYTICDTAKFVAQDPTEAPPEDGFDIVPASLITGIITEDGLITPDEVVNIVKSIKY